MEELLWKRHILACSLVQTKPEASSPRSMLRRLASCLRLDAWLLTLCGVEWYHSQALQPGHFVCWRKNQRWNFRIGENEGSIPWFFRSFSKPVLFSRCFWPIAALNKGFLELLMLFPSIFLTILDTVETEIFFFCASLVIFWHGSLSMAFLVASWLISWGLPDRGRSFRNLQAFKRCSTWWTVILLTFNCLKFQFSWGLRVK